MRPFEVDESRTRRMRHAVVCASNFNRSMEVPDFFSVLREHISTTACSVTNSADIVHVMRIFIRYAGAQGFRQR